MGEIMDAILVDALMTSGRMLKAESCMSSII